MSAYQEDEMEYSGPRERYDPREAYYARLNPVQRARQADIANHQFSDSIGGCASNYRK
jgi:hypothetical protein